MSNNLTFSESNPLILADVKIGLVPALLGEAGIGKSSFLKDLARKQLNSEVFVLSINNLAGREDLTGARLVKDENTNEYMQMFFPHEAVVSAISYANAHPDETPILFLDEFNRTSPDVTSAVFQLITERKLGSKDLPDNLRLVVAGNDKGNVNSVDSASVSRLVKYNITPDLATFLKVNPKLNKFIKSFLQSNPSQLLNTENADETTLSGDDDDTDDENENLIGQDLLESFNQIATPRTWTGLSEKLTALGVDYSGSNAEHQALAQLTSTTQQNQNLSLLDTTIRAHIGDNEAADSLSQSIQTYYENTFPTNFAMPQAGPVIAVDAPLEHQAEIEAAIDEIKQSGSLDQNKIDETVVADSLIWLANDENSKQFDSADLQSLIFAWSDTLTNLPKSQFKNQRLNAFTTNISNGSISPDSKFLTLLNQASSIASNSEYIEKMNNVINMLLSIN